ncbi:3',5'-cyclic adenosine monophosphate phosphodiesterase CpdA [Defluviimonas aquaemixtae]|uniref:3',5'-cyclic adenosine monophosphate phosphodiesterase CpdA n=1 Tax=Albidovulum aquaemixtae TaxID=1542388 RepID=A0A2R8BL63_9RHOB|nr:metallophosphoesterase [Defluviimonas aquaemixtae]SPH24071.1 3',5'-cyclic adenosine monophosphate phosphodiesterase CpdA [Defluviimonas aquaemixtae]
MEETVQVGPIDRGFAPVTMFSVPRIVRHRIADARWTLPDLRIAVVSDLHVCRPWTSLAALRRIVNQVNALRPDLILLPGDFIADSNLPARHVPASAIVAELGRLRAPLGMAAVLGNHDWWDCALSRETEFARNTVAEALEGSPVALLSNRSLGIEHGNGRFWIVGIDSQHARKHLKKQGFEDPDIAFAGVPDGAPAILLAHEPDYFAVGDPRAFVQVSGHTHGGQANLFGWRPMTPSAHGSRYAWGHIREAGRHLIVSGGIGYSGVPLRILQPPEITLVTLQRGG